MAKSVASKKRTLSIMKALLEKSDEAHRLSTNDLLEMLEREGISTNRKSIYDDIETLKEWGMDILYTKEKPAGYYVGSRKFELPELKLLVDAVQSSKFITVKKSRELIKKLESLASVSEAAPAECLHHKPQQDLEREHLLQCGQDSRRDFIGCKNPFHLLQVEYR